jgi:hypothetical protein
VKIFWGMLETMRYVSGTLLAVGTGIALAVPAAGINGCRRGFARFASTAYARFRVVWAGLL